MDALTLLKKDHQEVEKLFKRFEKTSAPMERKKIVEAIIHALSQHAALEEQFLYPALRERGEKKAHLALEALEEHHVVKWLLDELDGRSAKDERFAAKVKVMIENVRHHVEEEETALFAVLRRAYSKEELADLGELMREARRFAPTHPHPRAPDEPPGNLIAGAMAGLLDRGRDLIAGARRAPRQQAAREAGGGGRKKK
jgi:hemerythrin superfamily protein